MSVYAAKRVIGEAQWSAEQLEQVQQLKLEDDSGDFVFVSLNRLYVSMCLLDKPCYLFKLEPHSIQNGQCVGLQYQLMTPSFCIWFQQCKLGIVKFIEAKQVPEVETVVHLVVASSDTRHSVATAADLELKSKQR